MPQTEQLEVLIVGSGAGGKLMAWHMAQSGRRTAVVERRWIGGSCPNIACMPTKNEISGAKVAYLARHAAQFGTTIGPVAVDMAAVRKRKREMVERQVTAHLERYRESGAELIMGSYSALADADFAHPTMAEGLSSLFSQVPRRPLQQRMSKTA
jgi:pyruvate/2-oxoglutarate dehydrogenase complex dihydrolipoamide dehydrogenase (E3) component